MSTTPETRSEPLRVPLSDQLGPLPEPYARVIAYTGRYSTGGYCAEVQAESVRDIQERLFTADQMRVYAEQAVAVEREACADEADYWIGFDKTAGDACDDIARAIRGRGAKQWLSDRGDALGPLRRLWPLFEKATKDYVFTAEQAGEVAADMAAMRKALGA